MSYTDYVKLYANTASNNSNSGKIAKRGCKVNDWLLSLKVNDKLDVFDDAATGHERWHIGTIIQIKTDANTNKDIQFLIHYDGWTAKWNEWMNINETNSMSHKLRKLHTITPYHDYLTKTFMRACKWNRVSKWKKCTSCHRKCCIKCFMKCDESNNYQCKECIINIDPKQTRLLSKWLKSLRIDDKLEIFDYLHTPHTWYMGTIIDIKSDEHNKNVYTFSIHYDGWPSKWNESVIIDYTNLSLISGISEQLQKAYSNTPYHCYGACDQFTKKYGAKGSCNKCCICNRNCCTDCFMIRCGVTAEYVCKDCRKCVQYQSVGKAVEDVLFQYEWIMDVNVIQIIIGYTVCDCQRCSLYIKDEVDTDKMAEIQCNQCKEICPEYMVSECVKCMSYICSECSRYHGCNMMKIKKKRLGKAAKRRKKAKNRKENKNNNKRVICKVLNTEKTELCVTWDMNEDLLSCDFVMKYSKRNRRKINMMKK